MKSSLRVAVIGVGNCASSLVQGVQHYAHTETPEVGLANPCIGRYNVRDIEFSAAFDVNVRKVGLDLSEAIFADPNCTLRFATVPYLGVEVVAGPRLDGIGKKAAERLETTSEARDVAGHLRERGTDVVVNYLPVGSKAATEFYASAAIEAGCAFVNAIPVFLARQERWCMRFSESGLPLIGDDVKSQVGATIVHRALAQVLSDRGVELDRTYQLNVGGNMDFWNMLEDSRLEAKRESKSRAVCDVANGGHGLDPENVHIGPSDYVPWLGDRKVAFIRLQGSAFGGAPLDIELRMEVWDSPNSGGVIIDAVRYAKLALDKSVGGPLKEVSAWLMKSPPIPIPDEEALRLTRAFIDGLALGESRETKDRVATPTA